MVNKTMLNYLRGNKDFEFVKKEYSIQEKEKMGYSLKEQKDMIHEWSDRNSVSSYIFLATGLIGVFMANIISIAIGMLSLILAGIMHTQILNKHNNMIDAINKEQYLREVI